MSRAEKFPHAPSRLCAKLNQFFLLFLWFFLCFCFLQTYSVFMLLLFFLFLQYFARQVSENPALENVISSLSVNANALSKLGCCLFMRATHRQGVVVRWLWGGGSVGWWCRAFSSYMCVYTLMEHHPDF